MPVKDFGGEKCLRAGRDDEGFFCFDKRLGITASARFIHDEINDDLFLKSKKEILHEIKRNQTILNNSLRVLLKAQRAYQSAYKYIKKLND